MNKKSNVLVGGAVLVVLGGAIAVYSLFGGGEEKASAVQVAAVKEVVKEGVVPENFIASKQGKKYFPVDCGTAKAIKEENKVYFGSEEEAKSAGYERSLTCK